MAAALTDVTPDTVRHYLERLTHLLTLLSQNEDRDGILSLRLAPDMFDTGFNFAIAIQFAARALCPPAGEPVPDIPDTLTCESLSAFADEVSCRIATIGAGDLRLDVSHRAGEAQLTQAPADYVCLFALPNMLFHLSIAYAGLRRAGMAVGKADFDGFHAYRGPAAGEV